MSEDNEVMNIVNNHHSEIQNSYETAQRCSTSPRTTKIENVVSKFISSLSWKKILLVIGSCAIVASAIGDVKRECGPHKPNTESTPYEIGMEVLKNYGGYIQNNAETDTREVIIGNIPSSITEEELYYLITLVGDEALVANKMGYDSFDEYLRESGSKYSTYEEFMSAYEPDESVKYGGCSGKRMS